MREKLIELLYDNVLLCNQKIEGLAEDVIDLLTNGVTVNEWVSVKDRLPEYFGTFVVALKDMNGYCSTNAAYYDYSQQRWRGLPIGAEDEVTHWMPLPEPPKGE